LVADMGEPATSPPGEHRRRQGKNDKYLAAGIPVLPQRLRSQPAAAAILLLPLAVEFGLNAPLLASADLIAPSGDKFGHDLSSSWST
jgi:hypothetical protein